MLAPAVLRDPALRPVIRRGAALALGVTLGATAGHAQTPVATEYLRLVERYGAGDAEAAAEALAAHDDVWIGRAWSLVAAEVGTWQARRREAAALLHADVVIDGWVLPAQRQVHLDIAQQLLESDGRGRVEPTFRRDLMLVVIWHLQAASEHSTVVPWLEMLSRSFPDDPEALVTIGSFYEALGEDQELPADPLGGRWARILGRMTSGGREAVSRAASTYRRAIDAPGSSDQARVRLAKSLLELGQPAEALRAVGSARSERADAGWRYMAWMVTGRAETALGQHDRAAAAYEEALALEPFCRTAIVGLSAARRAQGRMAEAAALVEQFIDETRCDDPWWHYRLGQTPERRARLLLDLRRRVTSP